MIPFAVLVEYLVESYRHIEQNMEQNDENYDVLQKETPYGHDITDNARIAKMNMILAGDGHNKIIKTDSLVAENLSAIDGLFDVVITNFPFAQDTDHGKYYNMPPNKGNRICLQHCYKVFKEGGRMAVVVPETIIFKPILLKRGNTC